MIEKVDAVVIGGGFYGSAIALYLMKQRGLKKVILVEKEPTLMARASHNNQARIHNGYHYPRSFTTAYRSRINLPHFVKNWPNVVSNDFIKIYAIARRNSKVNSKQFARFCSEIGARIEPANLALKKLFDSRLTEDVFLAEEFALDAIKLAKCATQELQETGVEIRLQSIAKKISMTSSGNLIVIIKQLDAPGDRAIECRYIFNCTYSGLNQLSGEFPGTRTELKHEIAELVIIKVPPQLEKLGITVMDGPFFSTMPFPSQGLHSLSHVRYTPHFSWKDHRDIDPYSQLDAYDKATRADRMIRDASRYVPSLRESKVISSLFEVKTVLTKNEGDDGRPILFEKHITLKGCYSILGGKLDNIYDVLETLESEHFQSGDEE